MRITPIPVFDASIWMTNEIEKSGNYKTGVLVNTRWSLRKAWVVIGVHKKASFLSNSVRGAAS